MLAPGTRSSLPDAGYLANTPPGMPPLVDGHPAIAIARPPGDYAWTHSAPVEGFFVVLTAVVVPIAIVRWSRRLRGFWRQSAQEGTPSAAKRS
jgi:hypothetical protein